VFLCLSVSLFSLPVQAFDTGIGPGSLGQKAAANSGFTAVDEFSLSMIIGYVVQFLFGFLGIIFTGLILYSGYNWMTAQGDEAKVDVAKDTINRAVIGLIICLSGYAISNFVISAFVG
jgi:hypothetical protein